MHFTWEQKIWVSRAVGPDELRTGIIAPAANLQPLDSGLWLWSVASELALEPSNNGGKLHTQTDPFAIVNRAT